MHTFDNEYVSCAWQANQQNQKLNLQGKVKNPEQYEKMLVIAAHPIDRITSYSGSGLPWPCPGNAFEDTPNVIHVNATGVFQTTFVYPNSYYTYDGLTKVPPSIFVVLHRTLADNPHVIRMELPETPILSLRSLTHRSGHRAGPSYYSAKEELMGVPRSAEETMLKLKDYKAKYNIA